MEKLNFDDIKQKCPAFQNGCPYATGKVDSSKCPAFQNGCPFANKSVDEVNALMETLPKGHPACPVDEKSDVMSLVKGAKEKCPAFASGCPYAKEGTSADIVAKCPAFNNGCPFHTQEVTASGCPFLNGQMTTGADVAKCPALNASTSVENPHGKTSITALQSVNVEELKKQCPAFQSGCPYSNNTKIAEDAAKCPAFTNGCPFSAKSHDEIKDLIAKLPEGHPVVF